MNLSLVVGQLDGAPHATGQQHGVLPNDALGDVDEALVDRRDRPPVLVLGFHQACLKARDDRVTAVLADEMPNLFGLGTIDEGLLQPSNDLLHVLVERLFRAVVVDQVLKHVAGELIDARVDGVSLVDDLAFEDLLQLFVHLSASKAGARHSVWV